MFEFFESGNKEGGGKPEMGTDKSGIDYNVSKIKLSETEMEKKIDDFLKRPENQNVKITRETAKMAVESELERASKKIGKMYSENDDQKLAA
ncbi:MAG TPA: hypothetical protein P5323_02450 [Candidatus Moranbacteria bacterium]|nr:hypothetical protein [Candidatus Moranbacteria bacterium]HRY27973.1 hypothetical protein [Candidatus Moranbacteria bacterium]HSA08211.1 hypothetical protein [Candidatus Moranbacteria bacterium]